MQKVEGCHRGEIILYSISTCVWCKKTKSLLGQLGVAYCFVDVDLLDGEERKQIESEVRRWNPSCSYPTMVVDNKETILGYDEGKIREKLGP